MEEKGRIVQGMDVIDTIKFISKKNKTYQAVLLGNIENVVPKDSEEYKAVRKMVLDSFNNYTRSIFKIIFGISFEDMF